VAWLAAYARLATEGEAVGEDLVRAEAQRLARPAGWEPSSTDLAPVVRARVLWRGAGQLALLRAYRPHWAYFHAQAQRLYGATRFLLDPPPAAEPEASAYKGLVLFDFGLFFACHEHFERLWREAPAGPRSFYKGLVQLAAAFYHHEKGNRRGAAALLARAVRHLVAYRPAYLGLDVDTLLPQLAAWEGRFAAASAGPYPVLVARRGGKGAR
jgi:predicted metal-dependent hydrolase